MSEIKFVYFDVGETLYHSTKPWSLLTNELGPQSTLIGTLYAEYDRKMCLGEMSTSDIWDLYQTQTGFFKPYNEVVDYLQLNGFIPIKQMHQLVEDVSKSKSTGLLTNMYAHLLDHIFDQGLLPDKNLFTTIIDSSEIHMVKPDKEIFDYATQHAHCDPSSILFIDNDVRHITAANSYGWQTYQFNYDQCDDCVRQVRNIV